jgi:hypothetical protein
VLASSPFTIPPARLVACGALTAFGNVEATLAALLAGESALQVRPVLGAEGGDLVPLAVHPARTWGVETAPPDWLPLARDLGANIPGSGWGSPRRPVIVTSSNFGVGNLLAFRRGGEVAQLAAATPFACVDQLTQVCGWGEDVTIYSHACVSAHLGLAQGARLLAAGLADEVLVFSFDFLSPFVTGGFHALKILNAGFPAPYAARETGSIGLGDGAAWAVLGCAKTSGSGFTLGAQALNNEMHHFTANRPDGAGFAETLADLARAVAARGLRPWVKGHGTGTLEAGRLEAAACASAFPGAPLVGWKGALGHTLGSCGLVELALAVAAVRAGRTPGTVGTTGATFSAEVATTAFANQGHTAAVLASNAFGGAHAALLLTWE